MPASSKLRPIRSLVLGAAVLMAAGSPALAAEIKMIASNAVKEPYMQLVPQFERLKSTAQSTIKTIQNAGGSLASAFKSESACKKLS